MLADVFKTFKMCLEIYGFDYVHFLSGPGLPWQADLRPKDQSKLHIDMLLMVEKGIWSRICHAMSCICES